jgi:hypothetical protein
MAHAVVQRVEGQLLLALESPCGDQRPGAEVDATGGGTGVITIAPEVAIRPQGRVGPHVQGVVIRPGGETAGEREDPRAGRQRLDSTHGLPMLTTPEDGVRIEPWQKHVVCPPGTVRQPEGLGVQGLLHRLLERGPQRRLRRPERRPWCPMQRHPHPRERLNASGLSAAHAVSEQPLRLLRPLALPFAASGGQPQQSCVRTRP